MNRTIVAISAVAAVASPAQAAGAFAANRGGWLTMPPAEQRGYVMGAFDEAATLFTSDSQANRAEKAARSECVAQVGATSEDLRLQITKAYDNDPSTWTIAPNVILRQVMAKMCGPEHRPPS